MCLCVCVWGGGVVCWGGWVCAGVGVCWCVWVFLGWRFLPPERKEMFKKMFRPTDPTWKVHFFLGGAKGLK